MAKKNLLNLSICTIIGFILVLSMTFTYFLKTENTLTNTRTIEVEETNYGQSVQNILNLFDDSSNNMNGTSASFYGSLNFDVKNSGIEFLACGAENIKVTYSANYNLEQNKFTVVSYYSLDGVVIEQNEENYVPRFVEQKDDVCINVDGLDISIREILDGAKQDCFVWVIPMLGTAIVSLFVAATIPTIINPSFYEPVAETIDRGARSIWDWLTGLFKSSTQTKTVADHVYLTAQEIKEVKNGPTNAKVYQIAFVGSNGRLSVSAVYLNWLESIALINFAKPLNALMNSVSGLKEKVKGVDIGKLGEQAKVDAGILAKEKEIGIYTKDMIDAAKLAYAVGAREDSRGLFNSETHNNKVGSKYYYHFHDVAHTIHIWYGNPI